MEPSDHFTAAGPNAGDLFLAQLVPEPTTLLLARRAGFEIANSRGASLMSPTTKG